MPQTWKVRNFENKWSDKSEIDEFECLTLAYFTFDAREIQAFRTLAYKMFIMNHLVANT